MKPIEIKQFKEQGLETSDRPLGNGLIVRLFIKLCQKCRRNLRRAHWFYGNPISGWRYSIHQSPHPSSRSARYKQKHHSLRHASPNQRIRLRLVSEKQDCPKVFSAVSYRNRGAAYNCRHLYHQTSPRRLGGRPARCHHPAQDFAG